MSDDSNTASAWNREKLIELCTMVIEEYEIAGQINPECIKNPWKYAWGIIYMKANLFLELAAPKSGLSMDRSGVKCSRCGSCTDRGIRVPQALHMTVEDWKDFYFTLRDFKQRLLLRHPEIKE